MYSVAVSLVLAGSNLGNFVGTLLAVDGEEDDEEDDGSQDGSGASGVDRSEL